MIAKPLANPHFNESDFPHLQEIWDNKNNIYTKMYVFTSEPLNIFFWFVNWFVLVLF